VKIVARTVEVSPGCLIDLNAADQPVGIELIHPASSYLSLIDVVGRWQFDPSQRLQLGRYPYVGLTPRSRSAASTARATVRFAGQSELLTCA
jgi:hypothetical protein